MNKFMSSIGLVCLLLGVANADIISKNGIAKDTVTGLMWQDESYNRDEKEAFDKNKNYGKSGNWEYAKGYCSDLRLGGFSDWRLPNLYDLATLLDNTKSSSPYIHDGIKFVSSSSVYWTSSLYEQYKDWALNINFNNGERGKSYTEGSFIYIRCVRGNELTFDDEVRLKNDGKIKASPEYIVLEDSKNSKLKDNANSDKTNKSIFTGKIISEDTYLFRLFKSHTNGKCIRFNYDKKTKNIEIEDYFSECKEPSFYSKSDKVYDFMKYSDQFWNANIGDYSTTRLIPYDIDNKSFSVYVSKQLDLSEWVQATVMSVGVMGVFDIASRISGHGGMMNEHKLNPDAVKFVHKDLLNKVTALRQDELIAISNKGYLSMIESDEGIFKLKFSDLQSFHTTPVYINYFKYIGYSGRWNAVDNKARFTLHSVTGKGFWWDFNLKSKKIASNEYERNYGFMWVNRGKFRKDTYEIQLTDNLIKAMGEFQSSLPENNKLIYENETLLRCLNCDRPSYASTPVNNNQPANPTKNIWRLVDSSTRGGLVTRREHTDKYEVSCKNGKTGTMYYTHEYEDPWTATGGAFSYYKDPERAAYDACR